MSIQQNFNRADKDAPERHVDDDALVPPHDDIDEKSLNTGNIQIIGESEKAYPPEEVSPVDPSDIPVDAVPEPEVVPDQESVEVVPETSQDTPETTENTESTEPDTQDTVQDTESNTEDTAPEQEQKTPDDKREADGEAGDGEKAAAPPQKRKMAPKPSMRPARKPLKRKKYWDKDQCAYRRKMAHKLYDRFDGDDVQKFGKLLQANNIASEVYLWEKKVRATYHEPIQMTALDKTFILEFNESFTFPKPEISEEEETEEAPKKSLFKRKRRKKKE